jgi:YHS domain-containing protein
LASDAERILAIMKSAITFILLSIVVTTFAQQAKVFSTEEGAIRGYDVVAYFKESKPVKGAKEFTFRWNDADWVFSSAENLETFKAAPEKFAPQYGGYCAYGTSRGYKAETQPKAFTIFNNKLYLNYDTDVVKMWTEKKEDFIRQADQHWKTLESK